MRRRARQALKSKTVLIAVALAALGAVQENTDLLRELVSDKTYGAVIFWVGIAMAALRVATVKAAVEE